MAKPFCKVVPLTLAPNEGKFAVQSTGAQWGVYDTPEEAQEKADRLNEATRLPATREELASARNITLNGNPAKISGVRNDFATVTDLTTRLSAEWAWETVDRIVHSHGQFRS